jgi:ABC-2 type transport system ATP-binding protein
MPAIETVGLVKRFGSLAAVDGLSFEVEAGEIFGLLGPNGSGKTTTIRMLSCLIAPTEGQASVGGHDIRRDPLRVREIVGILTENPSLYERLTAYENMEFFARAYGVADEAARAARIREVLEFFELWERRSEKVGTYSKGMKQKLAIARAIVHNPEVLFLDEPTTGLDPKASKDIRDMMERLSRQEKHTILLCTHNLEDAERLCRHVMIINKGKSIVAGTTDELRRKIAGPPKLEIGLIKVTEQIVRAAEASEHVRAVEVNGANTKLMIDVDDPDGSTPYVVKRIVDVGGLVRSVQLVEPSLEEAYLKLVKEAGA